MVNLWTQVQKFIWKKAWQYMQQLDAYRGITLEDLYQSGFLALTDAVSGYDPGKSSFLSYLSYHLQKWFRQTAGLRTDKTANDPITSPLSLDDVMEGGERLGDLQPDPHNSIEDAEAQIFREELRAALDAGMNKYLTPAEAAMLRKRYFQGMPRHTIAEEMEIPEGTLVGIEKAALRKLRQRAHLEVYLDDATQFYASSDFRHTGFSPVERIAIRREWLRKQKEGV